MDLDVRRIVLELSRLCAAIEKSNRLQITRQAYDLGIIDKTQYAEYIKESLEGDE